MKRFLFLALILSIALSLLACGSCISHEDANEDGKCDVCGEAVEPNDNGDGESGATDLVLVEDYTTLFAVVCASSLSSVAEEYVDALVRDLNNHNLEDRGLKINYDARGFDDVTEIIFGSPTYRGDAFIKDAHHLGHTGFSIEVISNKLLVLAGGDEGYRNAIDYIKTSILKLDEYEGGVIDGLVISKDTRFSQYTSEFPIREITIDGASITEYVITYQWNSGPAKEAARIFKQYVY